MATIYVDSAAGGTPDGTSWTDAWTTLAAAVAGATAADEIWIDDGHAEAHANTDLTLAFATGLGRVPILCVDKADDTRSSGANINVTTAHDIRVSGSIFVDGVTWTSGDLLYLSHSGTLNCNMYFENCTFTLGSDTTDRIEIGNGSATTPIFLEFKDCTFTIANAAAGFRWQHVGGQLIFTNCTITGPAAGALTNLIDDAARAGDATFISCDLSQISNIWLDELNHGVLRFYACKLKSGYTLVDSGPTNEGQRIELVNCQVGTDADPSYIMEALDAYGTMIGDAARYRTGGASDGERTNPSSWSVTTTASAEELHTPFKCMPIYGWTDGNGSTAYNYDIFFASGATLQDDEIWVEMFLPNSGDTTSHWEVVTTRLAPRGTPANVTSDGSSTWTGADVGTKQYLRVTHTPDKPGPVMALVHVAKPSERVSVDPVIVIAAA